MRSIGDVKQELLDKYDPDEIVDILNISTEEILDAFEGKIEDYMEKEYPEEDGDDNEGF